MKVFHIKILVLFIFNLMFFNSLYSSNLTEESIYQRCYAQMVRDRPPFDDAKLLQVRAGVKSGALACMELFDLAALNNNGLLSNNQLPLNGKHSVGSSILKTFHDFHRTEWLKNGNIATFANRSFVADWVMDSSSSSYFLTNALFSHNQPFHSVVTSTSNLMAIRDGTKPQPNALWRPMSDVANIFGYNVEINSANFYFAQVNGSMQLITPKLTEFGNLIGITPHTSFALPGGLSQDIYALMDNGGGLISTPTYYILNKGHNMMPSDGGIIIPRRWGESTIRDLLCRELPVIRMADAAPHVQADSSLSFRRSTGCMQCHHTMDNLAFTARNFYNTESGGYKNNIYSPIQYVHKSPIDMGTINELVDKNANFHRTVPTGRFVFRSYDGTLHDQELLGVSDVGNAFANINDLYACAAKRYFYFFTGVDVSLNDLGDPDSSLILNKRDFEYRQFVIQLGLELKEHQNARTLIKKIIESPFYKKSDYGAIQ